MAVWRGGGDQSGAHRQAGALGVGYGCGQPAGLRHRPAVLGIGSGEFDIAAGDETEEVAARRVGRRKIGDGRWSGHGSEMGDRKRESGDRRLEVEDQGQGFLAWVEWMSPLISLPVLMERFCRWDCSSGVM